MSHDEREVSSGEFQVPRFGLSVTERVEFTLKILERFNVTAVIDTIAKMEDNPCAECTTIIDLVRLLATQSGTEPEDMGNVGIRCRPDPADETFYEVMASLPDGTTQYLSSVRCQLVPWMLANLKPKE
jgi:hypothetical protein